MDKEETTKKQVIEENKVYKKDTVLRATGIQTFFRSKFGIVFILLVIVTFGLIGYRTYQQNKAQKQIAKKTVVKQVLVRRSKIPNIITRVTTAKAIDVKTGKVITAARIFSFSDKTIYLALDLNNAKSGTHIDYIRYLNGRYVDHGNIKIVKDLTNNINFSWTNTRSLGSVTDGKWKIATYTNGILEKRVNYLVQKNQVSYVYPDESISLSDADYQLNKTIAKLAKAK